MDEDYERLLSELRRANPVDSEEFADWVKDEGDRFLYARVLGDRVTPRTARRLTHHPVVVSAAAAAVLAVGIVILIMSLSAGTPGPITVSTAAESTHGASGQGGTQTTAQQLVGEQALTHILALLDSHPAGGKRPPTYYEPDDHPESQLVQQAVAAGVLLPSEALDFHLKEPLSRGRFALWVWRAWGSRLPSIQPADFDDLGQLSQEERDAINGLVQGGILSGYTDGTFRPTIALSPEDESQALSRVAKILGF